MVKLIVTDIDGTLVEEGGNTLNPEYYEVIEKLYEKGILFVAASGRHANSVSRLFAPVLDKIWIISQNGAVVGNAESSKVLNPIPRKWVEELWADLSEHEEVDSILDTEGITFAPKEGSFMYNWIKYEYKYDVEPVDGWKCIPEKDYSMVTIYHPESGERFVKEHIKDKWEDRLDMVPTGKCWVDCLMPGISKGNAAKMICKKLDIKPEDIYAFGDNINDMSMVEMAGTGFAVEGARPEVKAIADHIIPGYDKDGVLEVLKGLL